MGIKIGKFGGFNNEGFRYIDRDMKVGRYLDRES